MLVAGERNEAEAQGQQARQAVHLLTKVADIGFDDQLDPLQKEFLRTPWSTTRSSPAGSRTTRRSGWSMAAPTSRWATSSASWAGCPNPRQAYRKADRDARAACRPCRGRARGEASAGPNPHPAGRPPGPPRGRQGPGRTALPAGRRSAAALAGAAQEATSDDRLRLGQTLKSQGDLLRLNGQFTQAKPIYDRAIAELERAQTADPKHAEIRNELALAVDARGWINRELGEIKAAGQDYRRALDLLEKLVAEFPTAPRYRESLAKACNSLGLLEETTGRLAEAEAFYRRELPLVERLSQDFPDRPEHGRELARTLCNLGNVLAENRDAGAEAVLSEPSCQRPRSARSIPKTFRSDSTLPRAINAWAISSSSKGSSKMAVASIGESRSLSEALVKEFPDKPRYSEILAMNLADMGLVLQALNKPQAEATFQESAAIYEKLVAAYPDNFDYKIGQARCLRDQGTVVAALGHAEQAGGIYRKALALFDAKSARGRNDRIDPHSSRVVE